MVSLLFKTDCHSKVNGPLLSFPLWRNEIKRWIHDFTICDKDFPNNAPLVLSSELLLLQDQSGLLSNHGWKNKDGYKLKAYIVLS